MGFHCSPDRQLPPAKVCVQLAMAGLLISGPAGAGKSAEGKRLLSEATEPTILVEFQEILAFLLGLRRDPTTNRYPERRPQDAYAIPLAAAIRRFTIVEAVDQNIYTIASNSDGDPARRAGLVRILGLGATELIIDPGYAAIVENLSIEGVFSEQCQEAANRWFERK